MRAAWRLIMEFRFRLWRDEMNFLLKVSIIDFLPYLHDVLCTAPVGDVIIPNQVSFSKGSRVSPMH